MICLQNKEISGYRGAIQSGKKAGTGENTYMDGARYIGDWLDDMRHGHGMCYYASGDRYEGGMGEGPHAWTRDIFLCQWCSL